MPSIRLGLCHPLLLLQFSFSWSFLLASFSPLALFIFSISSISFQWCLMWYRLPCPTDSGLLIPFWTGFSLGLLCAQLGSLDSLPTGLMVLIPGSHVYLSRGYPLPSSIIKQTHNLFFFFCCISFSSNFLKSLVKGEGCCEYGMGCGGGGLVACSPLGLPLILLPLQGSAQQTVLLSCEHPPCFSPSTVLLFTQLSLLHPVSLQIFVKDSGLLLLPCLFLLAAEGGEAGYGFLTQGVGWNQCTKGKTSDLR